MPSYIAAIDQGTTSTRCIVFDRQGNIVSLAQKEHKQLYPQPGWVEHDPEEIWRNTLEVIALARIKGKLSVQDIAAVVLPINGKQPWSGTAERVNPTTMPSFGRICERPIWLRNFQKMGTDRIVFGSKRAYR